jgi:hypothetical protein
MPPGGLAGATLTCRSCGVQFSPITELRPTVPPSPAEPEPIPDSASGVWVGVGPAAPPVVAVTPAPANAVRPSLADVTPENAAAHTAWLRAETERFQAYVDRQLAALGKMREQVAAFEAKARADALTREQGLNRDRALVEARAADLAQREATLAAALTRQGDEMAAELNQMVAAERDHLGKRAADLEQTERSLQVRLAEVEELEQTLRQELDEREAAVERERRELDEVAHELRTRTPAPVARPRPTPVPASPVSPPPPPPAFACE